LFQPLADLSKGFPQPLFQRALEFLVHRRPDLFELPGIVFAQSRELFFHCLPHPFELPVRDLGKSHQLPEQAVGNPFEGMGQLLTGLPKPIGRLPAILGDFFPYRAFHPFAGLFQRLECLLERCEIDASVAEKQDDLKDGHHCQKDNDGQDENLHWHTGHADSLPNRGGLGNLPDIPDREAGFGV